MRIVQVSPLRFSPPGLLYLSFKNDLVHIDHIVNQDQIRHLSFFDRAVTIINAEHLFSYAILLPTSVRYMNTAASPGAETLAQASLTMVMSIGSILSSLTGGLILDGSCVRRMLALGAVATSIGILLVILSIAGKRRCRR